MSMRKRVQIGRRKPVEEAEIIIIPMIDTMMFLLFFFMVASLAMVVQAGLPVNLPKASTSEDHSSQNVTITMQRNGAVFVNTTLTPLYHVAAALEAMHIGPKNLLIINADKDVLHGAVVTAMDQARQAGVTQFAIATTKE